MIKKIFRQMLFTQILSAMTVTLCMLVDSIMIGRFLGVEAMTAYGLATPLLLVFAAVGSMISAGVQVMCGRAMGSGDREGTDACFSVSLFLTLAVSAVGTALVLVFTGPLAELLGAEPGTRVFELTKGYMRGFIIGAPGFMAVQMLVPYMQMSGSRARLVAAVIAMTVADIAADLVNVFAVKWDTFGMGLASSVSYYAALAIGIGYFFKKDCLFRFRRKLIKGKTCAELLKYGVPTVVNQISLVLLVFVLNKLLIGTGAPGAVAAYSVISSVANICYCFGGGCGSVALMLSALFYSDADRTSLRELVKTMTFWAVALDLAVTGAVAAAASPLVALFIEDASAQGLAVTGLRLFVLSLLPCGLNTAFKNYYQGVGRSGFTQAISVMQNFALVALSAFVFSRFLGVTGVWLGYVSGETLTWLVVCAVVFIRNKKAAVTADAFSLLPADFGAKEGDCMEATVTNDAEAVEVSRIAEEFCRAHGRSPKESGMIALCVEEMTENIVAHGFTKGGRDHRIDVRLTVSGGDCVIRIRDNCVNFDPVKYMELHSGDDPFAHIGIRMVMKTVKDADYVNTLGLNNLRLVV
ncbi:MAG: ATP-binding protein [Clostridia bacterium]|nr:ATP-binding protein [Clostridia bacterium]